MKPFGRCLILCTLLWAFCAQAQLFKRDADDEIVQPDEEKLAFPAAPREENLLPFDPGFATNLNFYVDKLSLKVGETDRIVRYTLVIKSQGGATNTTYEALRCNTSERKIYAYALPDGSWSAARDPQWKELGREVYRRTLFNDFFCPNTLTIANVREGVDALIRGKHSRAPRGSDQNQN